MIAATPASQLSTPAAVQAFQGSILRPKSRPEVYATDLLSRPKTLLGILLAGTGSFLVTLVAWLILKQTSLPAFDTSMVLRAISTLATVLVLVAVAGLLGWWLMDEYRSTVTRSKLRTALTYTAAYLAPALLVVATVAIPLSASRLWLEGVQVDQVFRTQFLTRTTIEGGYADMNYLDMPTFYPLGWFWLGGRLAAVLGLPGWEVFQPWALISIAMAGSMLVPVWQRLIGSLPVATAIALTTTAVTLTLAAAEPYSAVIAMGVPAAAVMASHAFHGSWPATFGVMIYLGVSSTFYTLFTGAVSLTVVTLLALGTAMYNRAWLPLVRLVVMGIGSLAIAAVAWGPYVLASLRADAPLESTAQHYLPAEGTQIPVPFLAPSLVGILCFIGLVYMVLRLVDPDVRTLVWALGGIYLWIIASMALTLVGTTLLGFRMEVVVVLIMSTAGVLGLAEVRLMGVHKLYPARFDVPTNRAITWAFIVILLFSGIYYAQNIPVENEKGIDHAYTDTDGYGERADRYESNVGQYYAEMNEFIADHGYAPTDTVVLTDENLFMAYTPYHGFNAFTSHYANPLGEFSVRNEQIETWSKDSWSQTSKEFLRALDNTKWRGPDVVILRGTLDSKEGLKIHLAEDLYPNQPNVRFRAVFFDPQVFAKGWETKEIGPYVVAVRTR